MAGRLTIDDDNHAVPGGVTTLGSILSDTTLVVGSVNAKAIAIVDGSGNQITSFGGGTQYAELATTSPATGTLGLGRYSSTLPTLTNGQMNEAMLDASSILYMNMAYKLDAINDAIQAWAFDYAGNPIHSTSNALNVNVQNGSLAVQPTAATTGGYTPGQLISAASTNATSIKGSAGTLGYITASNINTSPRYLKIYNKASAPTVGTDTPVHTFLIPGNTSGAGTNIPLPPQGIALGTGIAIAITTGVATSDTGAVAANDIVINYGYN